MRNFLPFVLMPGKGATGLHRTLVVLAANGRKEPKDEAAAAAMVGVVGVTR